MHCCPLATPTFSYPTRDPTNSNAALCERAMPASGTNSQFAASQRFRQLSEVFGPSAREPGALRDMTLIYRVAAMPHQRCSVLRPIRSDRDVRALATRFVAAIVSRHGCCAIDRDPNHRTRDRPTKRTKSSLGGSGETDYRFPNVICSSHKEPSLNCVLKAGSPPRIHCQLSLSVPLRKRLHLSPLAGILLREGLEASNNFVNTLFVILG